jgi:hypothetical protein
VFADLSAAMSSYRSSSYSSIRQQDTRIWFGTIAADLKILFFIRLKE